MSLSSSADTSTGSVIDWDQLLAAGPVIDPPLAAGILELPLVFADWGDLEADDPPLPDNQEFLN